MRTFVIGDIHAQYKALIGCLKACSFDYETDRLIALGDVCDRGGMTRECIDELLKIKNCIYILGNHDAWALDWATLGKINQTWIEQGGERTILSYGAAKMAKEHVEFLSHARLWFEEGDRLFVHGGFLPGTPLDKTPKDIFIWDRSLLEKAIAMNEESPFFRLGGYDEVFLGHTPLLFIGKHQPQKFCNIWAMDTGAGYGRMLSIMDVETKQFWQTKVGE
ncbi:MAG: metallophosphoesterase [Candidatus Omnitrophica bacterium]|nr:metallophosphoesterase [Candidatus Omnitrophota bacterium]